MPAIKVFAPDSYKQFCELIASQLQVTVRLRGREISAEYGPPPVVNLPNMENSTEDACKIMYGFCLHEAGHLAYSNFKVIEDIGDYLEKSVHNCFEDEWMERTIDRDFPGGHDMLEYSHVNGHKLVVDGQPMLLPKRDKSFLDDDAAVREYIDMAIGNAMQYQKLGTSESAKKRFVAEHRCDPDNDAFRNKIAKRMELLRVCGLWLHEQRKYPLPLHDWPTHPWRPIFEECLTPRTRNSRECLEAARRIIDRLGLTEAKLPSDPRPIDEARELAEEAIQKMKDARDAEIALEQEKSNEGMEARRRVEASMTYKALIEAEDKDNEAREEASDASAALRKARSKKKQSKAGETLVRKRVAEVRRTIRELKKQARDCEDETQEAELNGRIERLEQRVKEDEALLERRKAETAVLDKDVQENLDKTALAKAKRDITMSAAHEAQTAQTKEEWDIGNAVKEEWKPKIERRERAVGEAQSASENATYNANYVLQAIHDRDSEVEAIMAPGAVEYVLGVAFDEYRSEGTSEELGLVVAEEGTNCGEPAGEEVLFVNADGTRAPARKYVPFDRSFDRVTKIEETEEAREEYAKSRAEYQPIINATIEKLKRLYSPEKNRVKVNAEEGRLDPRKAYQVALAMRGVQVDTTRVWKHWEVRKDPKVAASLVIDCSASMLESKGKNKTFLRLAQDAACALSEVMSALSITHEILGHTTNPLLLDQVQPRTSDLPHFSRFMPFQGYLYKEFTDKRPAISVFSDVPCVDNCDGEALLWAIDRLSARPEKTKICIVLSDGLPHSAMSNTAEMQRHLLTVCRSVEAKEKDGVFLFGLGIVKEHVKSFYKNAAVLGEVEDIPKAVLGVVEHILCELVGSLG